ncbi:hypothetical protein SLS54_005344 [Diplodia seriata]
MAQPGRIPRATDPDRGDQKYAQPFYHEAAGLWPATADTISLSSLHLVALAGRDVWGRTGRAQPLTLSLNERMKKQMCLVSVWIDKISEAAIDAYDVVEDIVLKAVENTDFETLEALAEKVAHVLFKTFIAGESSGSNLRIRIEKPTAVPLADYPAIEIYRTQAQVLHS